MKEMLTRYVPTEGRAWVTTCLHHAADWCVSDGIDTLVIFTGTGEGPHYAATELLVTDPYRKLKAVAVTPPAGRPYRQVPGDDTSPLIRAGLTEPMREKLRSLGVPVVSAHLPFKEMWNGAKERTSEWTRVAEAYGVLGGGFALCVQAALVACDAGMIEHGARVVALSADTAIVVRACRTESFLSPYEGLLVEHIICRPLRYNISKREHEAFAPPAAPESSVPSIETTGAAVESESARALPAASATKKPKRVPSTTSARKKTTKNNPSRRRS